MRIKHILVMMQNPTQMKESEEPAYNNVLFITVLSFALLWRFIKTFGNFSIHGSGSQV